MIERPLDLLNDYKGKEVKIVLKDLDPIEGILRAFDIHINLAVEVDGKNKFVRGDTIILVEPMTKKK